MKKFTRLFLGLSLLTSLGAQAQDLNTAPRSRASLKRCGTEDVINRKMQDPVWRAAFEARTVPQAPARTVAITSPVTIPVVVHVVLSNPYIITEAQVDQLIARLNLDFSGLNPDSANGANFYAKRGHSLIRFARAKRTPTGGFTTGLERRTGSITIVEDTYQDIKHSTTGGLDPWDITKYYNIWVGVGDNGLLGIAPTIGQGNATEIASSQVGIDGVCIDYRVFSTGCFSDPSFNMGRTVVHEIGHNFGLFHIFSGCSAGADFGNTLNGGLGAGLSGAAADDTPGQLASNATSGCPTGTVASTGCSAATAPNPPGMMYQNFMDYTDDACYSMFTVNQVKRMHYILETFRPGYLTTDGATAPVGTANLDAAPSRFINPNGIIFTDQPGPGCASTGFSVPLCPGAFTPRVEIINRGNTTITSVTIGVQLNSGATQTTTINGLNLTFGSTTIVSAPQITLVNGANVIKVTTSAPNGGSDGATANDAIQTTINLGPVTAPLIENFEGGTFPSANFNIANVHGDTTWRRAYVGAGGSTGSAVIDNYENSNVNSTDDIRLVPVTLTPGADSLVISFDVAYKNYGNTGYYDTLNVLVSNDCGATATRVFQKAGTALATAGSSDDPYLNPLAADWRRERVATAGALASGTVEVMLQNKTRYGNLLYIDNVNVTSTCKSTSISTQPAATQAVCANSSVSFSVAATGNASLTYKWYKSGNTSALSTSATYTIASAQTADAGSYYVEVTNACGVVTRSNDALLVVNTGGACGGTAVSVLNADVQTVVLMPNTIRNTSTLRVTVSRSTKIEWKVIDASGRVVKRFTQQAASGENNVRFDATGLATGTYQLVGDTQKGKTATLKFVRL
ncbi:MAG: T9SS type A sorting domain-containing protein [Chitinophagaceae bacterium]|nr:MAG: T9SS type A sorting domain-containing protein [Chitinophagaceae bacterium]